MFKFKKKLKRADLEELKKRVELIGQHLLIVQALEGQKRVYLKNILPKYGMDMNKNYEIDLRTGVIEVVEPKPQK